MSDCTAATVLMSLSGVGHSTPLKLAAAHHTQFSHRGMFEHLQSDSTSKKTSIFFTFSTRESTKSFRVRGRTKLLHIACPGKKKFN